MSPAGTSAHGSRATLLACGLLFLLTLAVFWRSTGCGFVNYDDEQYVTANPHVQQGLTAESVRWAFAPKESIYWHPLGWLSHMLDVELYGLKPWGHHLTNVLLHAANAVLLLLLLQRATGFFWRAVFAAALFALHPLRVESVTWVTERKDVLSGFFGLLTLLAYVEHARPRNATAGPCFRLSLYYVTALVCFACGLMSKSILVTWPVVMLLLDVWPLNRLREAECGLRNLGTLVVEKLPFFALSLAAAFLTFTRHEQVGSMVSAQQVPLLTRASSALGAGATYLLKELRPVNLCLPYQFSEPWPAAQLAVSAGVFLGVSALALVWMKRHPWLLAGWGWYLVTLLPVIGLVRVGHDYFADRFTYLPSIGFGIVLVWSCAEVAAAKESLRKFMGLAGALSLMAMSILTVKQIGYWHDTETLFRHTLAVRPQSRLAMSNLATELLRKYGSSPEALELLRKGLEGFEANAIEWNNYAGALMMQGQLAEATAAYEHALKLDPKQAESHLGLGLVLGRMGQGERGLAELRAALQLAPENPQAHDALGNALATSGDHPGALTEYRAACRLAPHSARMWKHLAWLLATDRDDALRNGHAALEAATHLVTLRETPDALDVLAAAQAEVGDFPSAIATAQRALAGASAELTPRIAERLNAYQSGHAWRE